MKAVVGSRVRLDGVVGLVRKVDEHDVLVGFDDTIYRTEFSQAFFELHFRSVCRHCDELAITTGKSTGLCDRHAFPEDRLSFSNGDVVTWLSATLYEVVKMTPGPTEGTVRVLLRGDRDLMIVEPHELTLVCKAGQRHDR